MISKNGKKIICTCAKLQMRTGDKNALCWKCTENKKYEDARYMNINVYSLPELKGSYKQTRWAEVLRYDLWRKWDSEMQLAVQARPDKAQEVDKVMQRVISRTYAGWWIDHRNYNTKQIYKLFSMEVNDEN